MGMIKRNVPGTLIYNDAKVKGLNNKGPRGATLRPEDWKPEGAIERERQLEQVLANKTKKK